ESARAVGGERAWLPRVVASPAGGGGRTGGGAGAVAVLDADVTRRQAVGGDAGVEPVVREERETVRQDTRRVALRIEVEERLVGVASVFRKTRGSVAVAPGATAWNSSGPGASTWRVPGVHPSQIFGFLRICTWSVAVAWPSLTVSCTVTSPA